jgi:hypothetical protein
MMSTTISSMGPMLGMSILLSCRGLRGKAVVRVPGRLDVNGVQLVPGE